MRLNNISELACYWKQYRPFLRQVMRTLCINGVSEYMSFKSWRSYWDFSSSVHNKNRYIFDDESKDFLESIFTTCEDRVTEIKKGTILWRSQHGNSYKPIYSGNILVDEEPTAFSPSRMKPLEDCASDGRANPKGIPYLYLATTKETAMSEVRPWVGSIVSTGQFKVQRDLKIIDFSVGQSNEHHFFLKEPNEEQKIKSVWADIDNAFSKPMRVSDLIHDYAPTQIIAEFIKSKGFDGIAYKSSLGDGYNIALFGLDSAKLVNCSAYEVKQVKFDFKRIEDPYKGA